MNIHRKVLPPDLLRAEDPELDPLNIFHRGLGVVGDNRRHVDLLYFCTVVSNHEYFCKESPMFIAICI